MKIGPVELLVILFVVFSVVLIFRLFRGDRRLAVQGKKDSFEVPAQEPSASKGQFKLAGILLVVIGGIVLFLGASLFEMVFKMYMWAIVLAGIGVAVLVFSRR